MGLWVAFAAGVLVGSFLGMFALALFIVAGERDGEVQRPKHARCVHRPDVIPLAAYRRTAG